MGGKAGEVAGCGCGLTLKAARALSAAMPGQATKYPRCGCAREVWICPHGARFFLCNGAGRLRVWAYEPVSLGACVLAGR